MSTDELHEYIYAPYGVQQQQRVHQTYPDLCHLLGYDPRWAELAEPNDADRADQQRQASGPEAER
jgi:hypothetical protein